MPAGIRRRGEFHVQGLFVDDVLMALEPSAWPRCAPVVVRGRLDHSCCVGDAPRLSSRIAVLAIDAVEPAVIADFRCRVLDWRIVEESANPQSWLRHPPRSVARIVVPGDTAARPAP
ncbi:hypothetical protein [Actinopolyspora halophila]|uniref:hypothetical protein n=1 Tax=Actinopolyspora halophila TaxID=1850 RepID=UPI0003A8250A|nr:hypothetical protein [Actinopolyspora halophila]